MLYIMFILWSFLLLSQLETSCARSLDTRSLAVGSSGLDENAWAIHKVDDWLPKFMQTHNIPIEGFLHKFPEAVGYPMTCTLEQPCVQVPDMGKAGNATDIQIRLVLTALTHFNDLFSMIHQLYSDSFDLIFRSDLIDVFTSTYDNFTPVDLNDTIPAVDAAHILFTPVTYVPNAFPNEALRKTLESVINTTTQKGFGYAWKDYAETSNQNQDYNNIQWSMQSAFNAWVGKYNEINQGTGEVTVLDFLSNGTMLRLKYAKDITQQNGWYDQATMMFTRRSLSSVLEANGVLLQRASYSGMVFKDAAMELDGSFDDTYALVAESPVHWGLDKDNNLTRQYVASKSFESITGIPSRVIYGLSWECFKATNDDKFYRKSWEDPDAYSQSLFIEDWDGTSDSFDMHNPLCTFNLPLNNQPSDIRTSPFATDLSQSCKTSIDILGYVEPIPYDVYKAFIIFSDAWTTTILANQKNTGNETLQLSDLCNSASGAWDDFGGDLWSTLKGNFFTNVAFGTLFGAGGATEEHFTIKSGSPVAGGFSPDFADGEPVGRPRSNAFDSGRPLPVQPGVNIGEYRPGMGDQAGGSDGSGHDAGNSGSGIQDLIKAAENEAPEG